MNMYTRVDGADIDIFQKPARLVVTGSSHSGKSYWCANLIRKYNKYFEKIVVIGAEFENLSDLPIIYDDNFDALAIQEPTPTLLVYDDSIFRKDRISKAAEIFARGRHKKISIILISQTLYPNCDRFRMCALNATHYILFRIRDITQVCRFSSSFIQKDLKEDFINLYKREVTGKKFGYLLLDYLVDPSSPLAIRNNIVESGYERAFQL